MREYCPRGLNYFAWFTLASTLVLICAGGLVTSKGVGMAVPDWPNSYGYNMFFFPVSKWVGGIFYEHLHRLIASTVGLLTVILALLLWFKEKRRWVRVLALLAVVAVILQGILGGLRVVLDKSQLGIFHALLAQLFFLMIGALAVVTSPRWTQRQKTTPAILPVYAQGPFRYLYLLGTVLILSQLFLGATMRHQHAGLAIPDFPLAYGQWWPPTDQASLRVINQHRVGVYDHSPVTAWQIQLQIGRDRLGASGGIRYSTRVAGRAGLPHITPPLGRPRHTAREPGHTRSVSLNASDASGVEPR